VSSFFFTFTLQAAIKPTLTTASARRERDNKLVG
jgi:hypothetical protein